MIDLEAFIYKQQKFLRDEIERNVQTLVNGGVDSMENYKYITGKIHALDAVSQESNAGDYGAVRTIFFGIGSMGPLYIGIVASILGYEFAFAGFILCMLLGAFMLLKLGTKYNHNSANATP